MKKFIFIIEFFIIQFAIFNFQSVAQPVAQTTLIEKVEPGTNKLIIPYEKYKLSNGLTVIIHEDHSDPVVHVNVGYHVGSARESRGKSGFAHFFEHMMFEGTEHYKRHDDWKIVAGAGGQRNGYTQQDETVYFELVPSNYLETALWLEADRMGFLLDSVTQHKFENQRSTVKNEKDQDENRPYGLVEEIKGQLLYPQTHPYSWPVIGYTDDLDRVNVDDLKKFFLRWYCPNNVVLTIAGDVNTKEALAMTEKYFGTIPMGPEVKKMRVPGPILANDVYSNYVDNTYLPMTFMVFPTVPKYHRDEAALDILSAMMGQGNNSIFYKKFVKTEKAAEALSFNSSSELAGEFSIEVLSYPDYESLYNNYQEYANADEKEKRSRIHQSLVSNFNDVEKKVHEIFEEFEKTGITDSALDRVKGIIEAQVVGSLTTVSAKATALSEWQIFAGKPSYNLADEYDRYSKVTKDDVLRVFNKYLKDKHAAIVNVFPKDPTSEDTVKVKSLNPTANLKITDDPEYAGLTYVKAKDNFDRNVRPVPGQPKTPVVPQYFTHQLKNGLKVIGTQDKDAPEVFILINIEGGDLVFNDPKKVGLAQLTAELMNEGTQKYTTEEISAELDKLGSSISFSSGKISSSIRVSCLTKNVDATLKLLEEKLLRPRFDEKDFKRIKKQMTQNEYQAKFSPEVMAGKIFGSLVYGNNMLGNYVTGKIMSKFSLNDVKNYYQQYYSPSVSSLVVVGELPENEIMSKLDFLNKWQGKEVKIPAITGFPPAAQTQIYLAHKDDAKQSVINIGNISMPYDATGEFFKANVMNFPLGGSFISRLGLNIREDKGYTYGIYSYFGGSKYPGMFEVSTSVRRDVSDSSLAEIMKIVKDFKQNGVTEEEASFTKKSLLNSEALRYESPFQKAFFLSRIVDYNLPKDYTLTQAQILKDMTKKDMNDLVNKYIDPDKMVILVVGNKYLIKEKLERLGFGKVKEVDLE